MVESVIHIVIAKIWGGGEQYVYDVCKEMKKRGLQTYVAVDKNNIEMQEKFSEISEIVAVNLYSIAGLKSIIKLRDFIEKNNIRYINCHSGHALLLCLILKRLTDTKVIMFKHNALLAKNDWYHKWQRSYTDAYVCVSELVYNLQTEILNDTEKQKFYLIYNGIDTNRFNKYSNDMRERGCYVIGYAGRVAEDKGIEVLLEAFKRFSNEYNNTKLLLAGADEKGYLKKVQHLIARKYISDKVQYLGKLEDMEKFYKSINVLVLPSVVREAFGLVVCESIYCGTPVITTDSGAQKEIIINKNFGYIVEKNCVEGIVKALEYYKNNANSFDKDAEKYIKNTFSIEKCVDGILKLYKKI